MHLRKISLVNFKNFDSQSFDFEDRINCFVGNNGVGKTNVLDAIYYLSFAKSYFNPIASQNIRHEQDFFMLEGAYQMNGKVDTVICSLKKGHKKILKRNGKVYERFADHIGHLPLVIISPSDRDLILEGSDVRRKFMDGVISQSNNSYLRNVIRYNKVVSQRNALLKYFALNRTFDLVSLQVYDNQLNQYGSLIYEDRKLFLETFIPIFKKRYEEITNCQEEVALVYKTHLEQNDILSLMEQNLKKDRLLQFTSTGIHKDDLSFEIDGHPIKKFGSQGQQKSYLIALKLAQFDFMKDQTSVKPILLLDDIFDKLDDLRVAQLINLVNKEEFGQLFITDTHKERTEEVVKKTEQPYKIFQL